MSFLVSSIDYDYSKIYNRL